MVECRNFRIVRAKFRDYFRTVRVEFSELFSGSSNRIFGTVFGQSETGFRFGFNPGTNVFGLCDVFRYHNNSVTNHEGTKRCLVLYAFEIWAILYVLLEKN